jgi:hypothetical protein
MRFYALLRYCNKTLRRVIHNSRKLIHTRKGLRAQLSNRIMHLNRLCDGIFCDVRFRDCILVFDRFCFGFFGDTDVCLGIGSSFVDDDCGAAIAVRVVGS